MTAGTAGLLLGWRHWRLSNRTCSAARRSRWRQDLLVAATGNPVWWVLPALVGQLPIAVAKRRLRSAAVAAPVAPPGRSTAAR